MSDESYSLLHERLVEEYMDSHPGVSWTDAYNMTSLIAYDHWRLMEEELTRGQDQ